MKPAVLIVTGLFYFSCNLHKKQGTPSQNIEDYVIIDIWPNVFSPGELCFEEVFREHPNSKIAFYNRWGENVWEMTDSITCWEGLHQKTCDTLPSGVYFYVINFPSDSSAHGTVTLLSKHLP